jgi:hypothetical protein
MPTSDAGEPDLVPDPQIAKELGISLMTIWRWDRDAELTDLGWPAPVYIRKRKYRNRQQFTKLQRAIKTRVDKVA